MRARGDRIYPSLRVLNERPSDGWLWRDTRMPQDFEHVQLGFNIVPYLEMFAYRRIPNFVHLMEMYKHEVP